MAKIVGIYNNKGGVGKTTLTLFLSDFLSSIPIDGRRSRVLVIDFDPQSSCANALLGIEKVSALKGQKLTLPHALKSQLDRWAQDKEPVNLGDYIATRTESPSVKTRKTKLGSLDVIISEAEAALDFEESTTLEDSLYLAAWVKEGLSARYDFIFIDLPGNLSKRNGFALVGAFLADYFLIPTEPNRININAIPLTMKMLRNIRAWRGSRNDFKLLGFVLNKADRRTKQYKLHKDALMQFANMADCKIYSSILPPTPKLSNATDDSIEYFTLSDRYEAYYDHVRNIVAEVVQDLGFSVNKRTRRTTPNKSVSAGQG